MSLNSLRADHASSACNCSNSTPRLRAILSRTASDGFLIPRSISESAGAEMLIRRESSRPEIPFPFRVCRMKAPRFVVGILLIAVRTLQEWISNITISLTTSHIPQPYSRKPHNTSTLLMMSLQPPFCCGGPAGRTEAVIRKVTAQGHPGQIWIRADGNTGPRFRPHSRTLASCRLPTAIATSFFRFIARWQRNGKPNPAHRIGPVLKTATTVC